MKEIKAYIRPYALEEIIEALETSGAPGITVVEVHPVGYGFKPNYFSKSREAMKTAPQIVKIELTCHNEQVEQFIQVIQSKAHTGSSGDGFIFISPVDEAIKIKTGKRGADAL